MPAKTEKYLDHQTDFFIGITFTIKNAEELYIILLKKEIHQAVSAHRLFIFTIWVLLRRTFF